MKFEISNPTPFPFSPEQRAAYVDTLNGNSVSSDSCAGSGKSYLAAGVAVNYKGNVELIPFGRTLSDTENAKFNNFNNINSLNFHRRGIRLIGRQCDVQYKKVEALAIEVCGDVEEGKLVKGVTELTKFLKVEAFGFRAISAEEVADKYNFDRKLVEYAVLTLEASDKQSDVVDFEDMLRFPVLNGRKTKFNKGTLVILDEVQDYSPLAWEFIKNCLVDKNTHVLMIGDPSRQCLMSFAGANPAIFDEMTEFFGCKKHKLTVNRRCAKSIVESAPFRGEMVALDDAPMGTVTSAEAEDVINEIREGLHQTAAILSEANAPLVQLAINFLTLGIKCQMRTAKIEPLILRVAYNFLDTRKHKIGTIADKCATQIRKESPDGSIDKDTMDIINCISALEEYCLAAGLFKTTFNKGSRGKWIPCHPIMQALKSLAESNEGVSLLTGHVSKGLEWDTVFHLPARVKAPANEWQEHQANCVAHVIATRARMKFVTLNVADEDAEEEMRLESLHS